MTLLENIEEPIRILGLMSGTSMDGLDCGLFNIKLDKDYNLEWQCLDFETINYNSKVKDIIRAALSGDYLRGKIADNMLGQVFSIYVEKFLKGRRVDLIGSHGQTISHKDGKSNWQVGDPQYLHKSMGIPIVYDFRTADINAGGKGAPLIPFLDWLLFKNSNEDIITLNVGGISNVTFIPSSGKRDKVLGFDTGPGMGLIDECARKCFTRNMDKDGQFSKSGQVVPEILKMLMDHPFIHKTPPKSTGRSEYSEMMLDQILIDFPGESYENIIRTLVVFTAKSISLNIEKYLNFNALQTRIIISGGGVNHPVLMDELLKNSVMSNMTTSSKLGIDPNMKESLLMAVLAAACYHNLPANMVNVTGAKYMVVLGEFYKGN